MANLLNMSISTLFLFILSQIAFLWLFKSLYLSLRQQSSRPRDKIDNDQLFDTFNDGIAIVEIASLNLKYSNQALNSMFGYSIQEMKGKNIRELHASKDMPYIKSQFELMAQGTRSTAKNIPCLQKNGETTYVDINSSPVTYNKSACLMGIFKDITPLLSSQQQIDLYNKQLKDLANQLTIAEESERHRIALGLHDHTCQELVAARLKLQSINSTKLSHEDQETLKDISNLLSTNLQGLRKLIFELSPPSLHELGFEGALPQLTKSQQENFPGKILLNMNIQGRKLNKDRHVLIYQVVKELLHNSIKHSKANEILISVSQPAHNILITIKDNGVGFDKDHLNRDGHHFGLFNVKERVNSIGGEFKINSKPKEGTEITLHIPYL